MSPYFNVDYGKTPYILVIDDILRNLQVIGNILIYEGFEISTASNGIEALDIIEEEEDNPDLILLDIMMPGMNGFEVCSLLKEHEETKNIPIIFLTAKTETDDIVKGFESGGVDYITKPFQKEELLARIKTHLDLKFSKEIIKQRAAELEAANLKLRQSEMELKNSNEIKDKYLSIITSDISKASDHVISLLPDPIIVGPIQTKWRFIPSTQLGGDAFGYHWLDDEHFAMYLLDVCGHGIGSALHSVSALNTIKFKTLPATDFRNTEQVCNALNKAFQMSEHNEMYFTIWYGVYNIKSKVLEYCGAGHPPALIMDINSTF